MSSVNFDLLKAGTVNVNSISNKVNYVMNLLKDEELHILALSETWLTNGCSSSFVDIPGFSLCRGDVFGSIRKHGAAMYVMDSVKYIQVEVHIPNVVVIQLIDYDINVISIYRPPSYLPHENLALIELISEFVTIRETILLGDLNLPSLNWRLDSVHGGYINPNDRLFYDCFTECGLVQWVKFPTFFPSGNILDLVLTTDTDRIGDVYSVPPLPGCHHCPILCSIIFSFTPNVEVEGLMQRRQWGRADFRSISHDLTLVNWERSLEGLTVQEAYNFFTDTVSISIENHVPTTAINSRGKWMSEPPRELCTQRVNQWKKYKHVRRIYGRQSTEADTELAEYQRLNHLYRNFSRIKQANYEQKLIDLLTEAPKLFHSYLRERKKGCPSVGPLRDSTGSLEQSNSGMSELFVDAFASVFVPTVPVNPHQYQQTNSQMLNVNVSYEAVKMVLEGLSPSSSAGADGIHPSVLRHCSDIIALPLSLIIEKSFIDGSLPSEWKHSRVSPIFKAGSKHEALNYRPVSVTSATCKVAERLLANHITSYLEDNGLLSSRQFGFRKGRSTEDQLLLSYGKIAKEVDSGKVVDAVYLDYSKAFDVLSHRILLDKAESLGFSPQVLSWIRCFLSNRTMQVSVGGSNSSPRAVSSGVPQGSVLGPLLFIVYVNSLGQNFTCEWYSFADDLKLFVSKSKQASGTSDPMLQNDLDSLFAISHSWNLKLNPKKCIVMRFGSSNYSDGADSGYMLGGVSLKLVNTHRDLGVLVDSSLRFHPHIAEIVRKSSGLANQLIRSTVCRSPKFMVTLFISHLRPILDYCSTVWNCGYLGDMRKLEGVQRRWTSNVSGLEGLEYEDRLKILNLYSIRGRLVRSDLIKVWRAFQSDGDIDLLSLFERHYHAATRGHSYKISLPRCHSNTLRRFLSARTVEIWNGLPTDVVQAQTVTTFKARLDAHMGPRFFAVAN